VRGLIPLMQRELRELRSLALVSAALAPLGTLAFQAAVTRHEHGSWNAVVVLPVFVGFFALAVAADLFSADARSGRLLSLAHLPVSACTIWLAKVLAAALAIAVFAAWTLCTQVACLAHVGGDLAVGRLLAALPLLVPWLALLPALVAATMLWSALRVGGLAAALLGALTVGGPLSFGLWLCDRWELYVRSDALAAVEIGAAAVLLAASGLAATRGRLHLDAPRRPLLLGLGSTALVLLPAALVGAERGRAYLAPTPENPRMRVAALCASPDGRSVAVLARHAAQCSSTGTWLLALDGGARWNADRPRVEFLGFTESGLVLLRDDGGEALLVDPRRGEQLPIASSTPPRTTRRFFGPASWGSVRREGSGRGERTWRLHSIPPGVVVDLPDGERPRIQDHCPGVLLRDAAGGIDLLRPGRGEVRRIPGTAGHRSASRTALSPDGRLVLTYSSDGRRWVLSVEDGRVLLGPLTQRAAWLVAEDGDALALTEELGLREGHRAVRARVLFVASGREVDVGELRAGYVDATGSLALLPDGGLVALRPDGSVELLAADGSPLRMLLGPDGER
jgi:hypothetical protein